MEKKKKSDSKAKTKVLKFDDEEVEVLEGLEAVRKRFDMYAGSNPVYHMLKEIIDNSVDEFMNGFGKVINIKIDTKKNEYTVRDYGRGIPLGINKKLGVPTLELITGKLHSSGKFSGKTTKTSGGKNGIGIKIVSACAKQVNFNSYRFEGNKYRKASITYEQGKITVPFEVKNIKAKDTFKSGFEATFIPDKELFESKLGKNSHIIDINELRSELKMKCYINKGLKINLIIDDKKPEVFQSKKGLIEYINDSINNPFNNMETIHFNFKDEEENDYEIALAYNNDRDEKIVSYVNSIPTSTGTHETGFKQGYTKAFNDYIKNNKLLTKKDTDLKIDGNDIRRGLLCIISLKLTEEPIYTGQTKDQLGNPEMRGKMNTFTYDMISKFLNDNPKLAKALCQRIIAFAKATSQNKEAMKKIMKISQNSLGLQISEKFKDCEIIDPDLVEIFIVEGDSASGTVENGRYSTYQCVFPLRGKIKNTKNAQHSTLIANREINDFLKVEFGTNNIKEIRETLRTIKDDPENISLKSSIKSTRIIILTDADEDGSHITILFINFIYEHLPELIELGWLYIGVSPFYRVKVNNKWTYYLNNDDYSKFISKVIEEKYKVMDEENNYIKMNKFISKSDDYINTFNIIKDEYSIDSELLSIIIRETDIPSIKKIIKTDFGLSVNKNQVEGLYNDSWNSFNLKEVINMIEELELNRIYSNLNYVNILDKTSGEVESYEIYDAIHILKKAFKYKRNRMKGLGEMDADELRYTTLDPKSRNLIKCTTKDINDENENRLFDIIFGSKPKLRRELIKDNIINIQNDF